MADSWGKREYHRIAQLLDDPRQLLTLAEIAALVDSPAETVLRLADEGREAERVWRANRDAARLERLPARRGVTN